MKEALTRFVDHLERMQIRLHGTVPPVAAREIAKMRVILAEGSGQMPDNKKPAVRGNSERAINLNQ